MCNETCLFGLQETIMGILNYFPTFYLVNNWNNDIPEYQKYKNYQNYQNNFPIQFL